MVEGFLSELKLFDGEEHVRVFLSSHHLNKKLSGICVLWFYLQSEKFFSNFKIFLKMRAGCGIGYRSL